jgi:hypothetical protein
LTGGKGILASREGAKAQRTAGKAVRKKALIKKKTITTTITTTTTIETNERNHDPEF